MMTTRILALSLTAPLLFAGCNLDRASQDTRNQEMIQARLDAEKVKQLEGQTQTLQAENTKLRDENAELKLALARLEARAEVRGETAATSGTSGTGGTAAAGGTSATPATTARRPAKPAASAPATPKPAAAEATPTPAATRELKDEVTGGGSFK